MISLKYNTASQEISLGRFVDSTDGNTEETGLTINNTDIKLWKNGATTLANKNSGGATHIANGEYYCVLDATDTGTYGPMKVCVHVAGALPVQVWCSVMNAQVWDSLYGTDKLETDATQVAGNTQRATDLAEIAQYLFANAATLTSVLANNSVIARILAVGGTVADYSETTDSLEAMGTVTSGLATAQNVADTVRTEMEEVGSNLNHIHAKLPSKDYFKGSADADGGMDADDKTDVESETGDALAAIHLDHLLAADYNPASKPGVATALLNELVEDDSGVSRYTVNALENAPSGSGASAATIADAVWDELQSDHVTAGRFGEIATEIAAIPTDKTGYALSAAGIDSIHNEVMEGTTTLRQAIRLILSVLTGKSSGGGTATLVFRDIGDTKNRISATVDANGNRSAVGTRDGT